MRIISLLSILFGMAVAAQAQVTYVITVDTTPLIGHPAGPFSLAFQLADGSGSGDGNNAAVISGFQFGAGGSATGVPLLLGGASGNLSSTVVLVETGFPNLIEQTFTPGASLSFQLELSGNSNVGQISDLFVMSIVDRTGTPIPTMYGAPVDVFVAINLGPPNPTIQTLASDPTRSPAGGGSPINIGAPSIAPNQGGCAIDVTSQFRITPSGFRFDNGTQQFVQTVTLQSITSNQIPQPVSLVLDTLSSNTSLFNKDSDTICVPALGSPYIILPSGSTSLVLSFVDPALSGITYHARVLAGTGTR